MAAESGTRRLALIVEHGNEIYQRVRDPIPARPRRGSRGPGVDRAWLGLEARRRDGMRQVIDVFARRDELRPGLDPTLALDLLFGVHRSETYLAFTEGCGWPMERYKAWQFATLARQLLPSRSPRLPWVGAPPDVADLSFAAELDLFR